MGIEGIPAIGVGERAKNVYVPLYVRPKSAMPLGTSNFTTVQGMQGSHANLVDDVAKGGGRASRRRTATEGGECEGREGGVGSSKCQHTLAGAVCAIGSVEREAGSVDREATR